jgi:osomolarity two-component system sensor histidine kinase NIK1
MIEKLNILVVDDNDLNQQLFICKLGKFNHNIIVANNGLEALELFKTQKFHFILMDLMMPIMDGYEATIKIREEEQLKDSERTPIIAFTANTMNNEENKCLLYDMDDFMTKPFDIEKLKTILLKNSIIL